MSSEGRLFDGYDTEDLAQEAIQFLRDNEPAEGYYVAFSGGKDSQVALDLVQRSGCRYDAHYHLTTCDPGELVHFIRREYPYVINEHPPKDKDGKAKTIWWWIERKGTPSRRIRYCCEKLKEGGGWGRSVVLGIRVSESRDRAKRYKSKIQRWQGGKKSQEKIRVMPILYWSETDVWAYIEQRGLKYCELYDEPGIDRLGCVLCPLASDNNRQHEAQRWPKIAAAWYRAIEAFVARRNANAKPLPPHYTAEYLYRVHMGLPVFKPKKEGTLFKKRRRIYRLRQITKRFLQPKNPVYK